MTNHKTPLERFNYLLQKGQSCWTLNVTPNKDSKGGLSYNKFWFQGKQIIAHIFAYETFIGPVPSGKILHHKCEYKPCCNPEHLIPVTNEENIAFSKIAPCNLNKVKTHCKYGHEFSIENTTIRSNGSRECKICHKRRRNLSNFFRRN